MNYTLNGREMSVFYRKAFILYTPANTITRRAATSKNTILHTARMLQTKIDLVFGKNEILPTHPCVRVRISRKKRLLAFFFFHVRPFVCQSAFASAAPTGWISVKFGTGGATMNVCRGTTNVVTIEQHYGIPYMMKT